MKKSAIKELINTTNVGTHVTYEQERNFDAGYSPSPTPHKFIRKEKIQGTWYRVYQG
jgi:hypothetical protein